MIHVLLADDNVMFLTQLRKYLTQNDVAVDTAQGGIEAIEKLERHTYDVAVLDLKMPDMSGLDVLREVQNMGVGSRFIILTGYGDVQSAVETMKLGAIDYLQKPFEGKDLLESIQNAASKPLPNEPLLSGQKVLLEQLRQLCIDSPVMVISEIHPRLFSETYGITAKSLIWLKDPTLKRMVSKPDFLLEQVRQFTRQHRHAVIVQYGIKLLQELYDEQQFPSYFVELQRMAQEGHCRVVFMYKVDDQQNVVETLQHVSLYPFIEDLVTVLGHKIRSIILQLLQAHPLRYRDLLDRVSVKHSSDLSHHLKVLREHHIIEKRDAQYVLTKKGQHYHTALLIIAGLNTLNQEGPVMYLPFQ
jgi:ActR/RegA family two-component response regulator/DNA-binding HxlR family transcriptional regulator